MSRSGSFDYVVRARCERDDAVTLLSTFSRHSALHPLIERVDELPAAPDAVRSYRITDRLRWGPFAFRIRYRADVLRADAGQVLTRALQFPATRLVNSTELDERDGVVTATVTISLTAPRPLFGYALAQARTAHAELADRLAATLEGR